MEAQYEQLAQKLWLKDPVTKADPKIIQSEIYSPLEASSFSSQSLLLLENLQIVERFLWPTFSENCPNQHAILLAAFVNVKRQSNLAAWSVFADRPQIFSIFFQRILSLSLDSSLSTPVRVLLLEFIIGAFQSLEKDFVRKECAPLVSIAIWHNLHSESHREKELQKSSTRQKAWKSAQKRFDSSGKDGEIRLQFDRAWLYSMVLDFLRRLETPPTQPSGLLTYCERFLEFLTDLISQLPTRRYTVVLLKDLNVLPILRNSKLVNKGENALLRDLVELYQHFAEFQVDDVGSSRSSTNPTHSEHYEALAELQRTALQHFESKLKVLALSNFASIDRPGELQTHLSVLSDSELEELCRLLGFRTTYPASASIPTGRTLFLQTLVVAYTRPRDYRQVIRQLSVLPTEKTLYDPAILRNETFEASKPLALPKLNLQYLSLDDFMWRSFQLHQNEAFYGIRRDMESLVKRMKPRFGRDQKLTGFDGFSKMGLPVEKPAVIDVGPAKVGSTIPSSIRAEVILDLSKSNDKMRSEWEGLRPKDVVFLLGVKPQESSDTKNGDLDAEARSQVRILRTAEVLQVLDENSKPLRDHNTTNGFSGRSKRRRLLLDLDPVAFHNDQIHLSKTKNDVWNNINIIARRQGRENNFRPILETIQRLVGTAAELPSWFQDVFLGYDDPKSASYMHFPDRLDRIDYIDTFIDWKHLQESLAGKSIETEGKENSLAPPFVLETVTKQTAAPNSKKRRREQMESDEVAPESIRVSTYKPPNNGPYPIDVPRKNTIRFTPKQISAITSGTQPGLSIIVGPPGTGKTDVATQIINLLYHNFPSERILLVAHSNQALNQLFQKIIALDIDSRHLLRLGHGEEELQTEASYSKAGRVESFMENRVGYLSEVNRLAASIGAKGAHGSTCETAGYFNQVFVQPAWSKFWSTASSDNATASSIAQAFPFGKYFSNAPVPELIPSTNVEDAREAALGCKHHLDKIFTELEAIRPFEILRTGRDQANHLLVREARIIAMTATHAAIRRSEIADLGFHYDTLIMEEAAQITEVESFIPCAMQNPDPKSGELPLKRVVLVGDHLQNSPVVQNLALRQYSNFEQSLFLRLVRLGVPTINLDQQGRCRPSLADLFNWRYENLTNLPHLSSLPEFSHANAGFRHEFQFVDVPDYQGQGEREPTAHFIQNLGEAEYAVALFQYMRLLGYPARSISILTTYAGQKALIRDVLDHRCKGNRLFGLPRIVTTVDKYQGEQNDFVILSLVRTKSVGYLRDVRRLTVALSRARLGLYVLGRRDLFETCFEMRTAMERLNSKGGDKLELVTNEMYPTQRQIGDDVSSVADMDGVEHLGQYVYEMTQAKIKSLGGSVHVVNDDSMMDNSDIRDVDELGEDADPEEDPLHESVQ